MGRKNNEAGKTPAALSEMTQEQLIELAVEKGVALEAGMEKEEIIKALIEVDPSLAGQDESAGDNGGGGESADNPDEQSDGPPAEIESGDIPVGTIRQIKGVEMVNVGTAWVPTIRESIDAGKPITVVCPKRAGKTIFAHTGNPITFDAEGRATVSAADGNYLCSIYIDGKPEYTAE